MRFLSISVIFVASAVRTTYGQCSSMEKAAPPGVTLAIAAEATGVEATDPVIVHMTFENSSKQTFSLMERFAERDFEVHVEDSKGREAPLTEYGKKIRTSPFNDTMMHLISFSPGDKLAADEDVRKLYKLELPGRYSVYTCRLINKVGSVFSNKIEVVLKSY